MFELNRYQKEIKKAAKDFAAKDFAKGEFDQDLSTEPEEK